MRTPLIILIVVGVVCVLVTGFWGVVSTTILPHTSWGLYSRGFFENLLVEMHGTVLDLFVVGVILYWFERRQARLKQRSDLLEALHHLRLYTSPDVPAKVLITVRQLLNLGEEQLELSQLQFTNIKIEQLTLRQCKLYASVFSSSRLQMACFESCSFDGAIFVGSTFRQVTMQCCSLRRAKFNGATLDGMDFTSCDLRDANFTNASLRSANFKGVDCAGVSFRGADLHSANFIGAKNVDTKMLTEAKSIRFMKTDNPEIRALQGGSGR
jgi:uncharacterized protein YjbI with pentapeptide repeats